VIGVFAQKRPQLDSAIDYLDGMKSDAVLAHFAPGSFP
jgi:hypothetical protein